MVDYTNPLMRDETYRRWKGGSKLADDLRNFYTNPRVWARLGQANPMGPNGQPPGGKYLAKWAHRFAENAPIGKGPKPGSWGRMARSRSDTGNDTMAQRNMYARIVRQRLSNRTAEQERSPSSQSGATL